MKKLRLILTRKCNRNCKGCCNNQDSYVESNVLPFNNDYKGYDQVIFTGGELSLVPFATLLNIAKAKLTNLDSDINIIVYTAETALGWIELILKYVNGITITLHKQSDVDKFRELNFWLLRYKTWIKDNNKTLRVNVFKGVNLYMQNDSLWTVKDNMEWIEDCPLPEGEIIRELR